MLPTSAPVRLAAMLMLLLLLLSACESTPRPSPPAQTPAIPPLPQSALQVDLPTFSMRASESIEQWQRRLIGPSAPASSASPLTRR